MGLFGRRQQAPLYQACEELFARHQDLIEPDTGGCCKDFLMLATSDGEIYALYRTTGRGADFGLFPHYVRDGDSLIYPNRAGHGSFAEPGGGFLQFGSISAEDFALIVTTTVPQAAGAIPWPA